MAVESYCPAMIAPSMADANLAQRLLDGDRRALARAISLVEDDRPEGWELVKQVYPHTGKAAVFGFTGPPGVGKSTLIGALTKARREAGRSVGVLSIDPSSPFTQGALLGDRIRLTEHFLDQGVFIRSMANRGSGDSIQALKAGVMEIPDVIVINKADHPLTDTMVREIRGVLSLANLDRTPEQVRGSWRVPIVKTEASRGVGVDELVARLDEHREHILAAGQLNERRARNLRNEVLAIATARMRRRLEEELHEDAEFQALIDQVIERRLDPASAAAALLQRETVTRGAS
jgi:LAO/AO transport system kinase